MWKVLTSLFLFIGLNTSAQVDSLSSAHQNNLFYFKVKSIDDFINRFNGNDSGALRNHLLKIDPTYTTDRKALINSLIEKSYYTNNKELCTQFTKDILDSSSFNTLDINTSNLYALINGTYSYNGEKIVLLHILKLETADINSKIAQWKIVYIPQNQLFDEVSDRNTVYLSPDNHNQKFHRLREYITPDNINEVVTLQQGNAVNAYYALIKSKNLSLSAMDNSSLCYYIYLNNYLLKITEYNREDMQSGYLISEIQFFVPMNKKESDIFEVISK